MSFPLEVRLLSEPPLSGGEIRARYVDVGIHPVSEQEWTFTILNLPLNTKSVSVWATVSSGTQSTTRFRVDTLSVQLTEGDSSLSCRVWYKIQEANPVNRRIGAQLIYG